MLQMTNDQLESGKQDVRGIVHLSVGELHECEAAKCPHKACGSNCAATARIMNQAHDAVLTLAKAIAPLFRDGGSSYLSGAEKSRTAAMAAIRDTSLGADTAASGAVQFPDPDRTTRDKWNFGYVIVRCCVCVFVCEPVLSCPICCACTCVSMCVRRPCLCTCETPHLPVSSSPSCSFLFGTVPMPVLPVVSMGFPFISSSYPDTRIYILRLVIRRTQIHDMERGRFTTGKRRRGARETGRF